MAESNNLPVGENLKVCVSKTYDEIKKVKDENLNTLYFAKDKDKIVFAGKEYINNNKKEVPANYVRCFKAIKPHFHINERKQSEGGGYIIKAKEDQIFYTKYLKIKIDTRVLTKIWPFSDTTNWLDWINEHIQIKVNNEICPIIDYHTCKTHSQECNVLIGLIEDDIIENYYKTFFKCHTEITYITNTPKIILSILTISVEKPNINENKYHINQITSSLESYNIIERIIDVNKFILRHNYIHNSKLTDILSYHKCNTHKPKEQQSEYRNTRYVYRMHNVSKSELKTCMIIHKLYNKYYDNRRYEVNFRLAIKKFNNDYYKILTSKSSGFYK